MRFRGAYAESFPRYFSFECEKFNSAAEIEHGTKNKPERCIGFCKSLGRGHVTTEIIWREQNRNTKRKELICVVSKKDDCLRCEMKNVYLKF